MAFRMFCALATFFDLDINLINVKTAFWYGFINQLIYIEVPKRTETKVTKNMVCKLLKVLYGLKESPRLWYKRFSVFLFTKLGLTWIHANHSIFVFEVSLKGPVLSVFEDDIKIMALKRSEMIERVNMELTAAFSIVDIRPINFYLGLKVDQDQEQKTIKLFYLHILKKC